jgi:hypothetical protein
VPFAHAPRCAVLASATLERIGQRLKEFLSLPKPRNLRKSGFVKPGETSLEFEKNVLGNVTVGRKRDWYFAFLALLQNLQRWITDQNRAASRAYS